MSVLKYRNPSDKSFKKLLPLSIASDELPIGTVVDYNGDTVPDGWAIADGTDVYSTSEVKTNKTWIDGKPIYRKVFTGNMTNTVGDWVNLQKANISSNLGQVTSIDGLIINTLTDERVLSANAYESTSYYNIFSYLKSTDYLQVLVKGWVYTTFGFKYYITLEYTKSS